MQNSVTHILLESTLKRGNNKLKIMYRKVKFRQTRQYSGDTGLLETDNFI